MTGGCNFLYFFQFEPTLFSSEALLKSSFVGLCNLSKTLVFTDFFEGSIARCEKHFSQFSRKNHAFFSHFRMTFEKIVVGSSDNLIHFGGILKWLKSPVLKTGRTVQCRRGGSNPSASARALEHYVPRLFSFLCTTMLSHKQLQHTTKSFISPEIIRDYTTLN